MLPGSGHQRTDRRIERLAIGIGGGVEIARGERFLRSGEGRLIVYLDTRDLLDLAALARGDGLERMAVAEAGARLHLHERDDLANRDVA